MLLLLLRAVLLRARLRHAKRQRERPKLAPVFGIAGQNLAM